MIVFKEFFSVKDFSLRYYFGDVAKYRFIPIDRKELTGGIFGYVVTPSGIAFPDTFTIWEDSGIEYINWVSPDNSVNVIFRANWEHHLVL